MTYLVKEYNKNNYTTFVNAGKVYVDTELVSYISLVEDEQKFTKAESEIREIAHKQGYITSEVVNKTLYTAYHGAETESGGIDLLSFDAIFYNHSFKLGKKEIELCKMIASVDEVKKIYVFDKKSFTEFWVEFYECSDEAEDKVFGLYGLFLNKNSFNTNTELITFDETELRPGTCIKPDILLKRKG